MSKFTELFNGFERAVCPVLGFGQNLFWGGGHTLETEPTRNGWKARFVGPAEISRVVLVGQKGVRGCATVVRHHDGQLDVALYDCEPKVIHDSIANNGRAGHDAEYFQIPDLSGCGLRIIQRIEKMREEIRKYEDSYIPVDDAAREIDLLEANRCAECGSLFSCKCEGRE